MVVFLCGFMGAGKSALLHKIARQAPPGWSFIDTDREVGDPAALVREAGWGEFRRRERRAIRRALESAPAVVALGGGALDDPGSARETLQGGLLVHLDVPFQTCWERIVRDGNSRPLAALGRSALAELYARRLPAYRQAHFSLSCGPIEGIGNFALFMQLLNEAACGRPTGGA